MYDHAHETVKPASVENGFRCFVNPAACKDGDVNCNLPTDAASKALKNKPPLAGRQQKATVYHIVVINSSNDQIWLYYIVYSRGPS